MRGRSGRNQTAKVKAEAVPSKIMSVVNREGSARTLNSTKTFFKMC